MTPEQFKREWEAAGETLLRFPESAFEGVPFPAAAIRFLTEVGLPRQAAPFLAFDVPKSERLRNVAELFGPAPELKIEQYYAIGSNGCGDPIVILPDGSVVCLNHDNDFLPVYMNRDVETLAEALLRYRGVISETRRLAGSDGFLNGMVPQHLRTEFLSHLNMVDARALDDQTMWAFEVASWDDKETTAMDDQYFSRNATWLRMGQQLVVRDSFAPKAPRMITMEPLHEIVFMAADGVHTIGEVVKNIRSQYKDEVPADLRGQIHGAVNELVAENILRIHFEPKPLPPCFAEDLNEQQPEVRIAQMEADGLMDGNRARVKTPSKRFASRPSVLIIVVVCIGLVAAFGWCVYAALLRK